MKLTLAAVRRTVYPVTVPSETYWNGQCPAGMYCLVDWYPGEGKSAILVRNMNSAEHAPAIADALRQAGFQVELVNRDKTSLNPVVLRVQKGNV